MPFTFIVNPEAGQGAGRRTLAVLQARAVGVVGEAVLHVTDRPGQATVFAREAAAHGPVVAVGGDGTVQEVLRGLAAAGPGATLGVLPCGTGNDYVKMLGMPAEPEEALAALATADVRPADYGRVRWWDAAAAGGAAEGAAGRQGVFLNAVGLGFDAAVAARVADAAARYKFLKGTPGYLLAVLHTLRSWQPLRASAEVTGADGASTRHEGALFMATASNGACSGGGFYLAPEARVDDGLLDVCLIRHVTTRRALRLLPTALRGTHVLAPEVTMHPARRLVVETNRPVAVHADGEMLTRAARRLEVDVAAGALRVLFPRNPQWNRYMRQRLASAVS